jgi:hypothetical protein
MAVLESGVGQGDPLIRITQTAGGTFPITGSLHERIAQVINARFEQSEAHHKGRFERFYRYEKLIAMISKKKSYEWKSNAYLPYALAAAEQSAAIKFLQLLMVRPIIQVASRRGGMEDVADHREALINWRLDDDINIVENGAEMLRRAERYGKAIALIAPDWDQHVLKYRERVNLPTTLGPISRLTWKTSQQKAYRIRFEPLDNTDVFPQPGFKRINGAGGMRWICRRYWLTVDELAGLEANELWGPLLGGQPVKDIGDTQQQDLNEYKAKRLFMDKYDDFENLKDQFDRSVEIIEYQGTVPDELVDPQMAAVEEAVGLNPKERLIALANRKCVGFNQAIPWDHGMKSYVEMNCIPNPDDFWGTGKVEPIEHLVYVGNEIVNMRLDNVKAAINGLIGVDGGRMPAGWKRRMVSQPWGIIETLGNPQDIIQRLQLGDVTASSYQEQAQVWGMVQEAVSINETMMGNTGGAVRTLGEHQMKAGFGGKRLQCELVTQAMELFGWSRKRPGLIYFIMGLDRQYLPIPQYMQVVNPDVPDSMMELQLEPSDLAAENEDFIYSITGALEGINREAKRMELTQLSQTILPFVQLALMGGFNPIEFIKTLLRAYDLDPDRLFPKLPGTVVTPDARGAASGPMAAMMMGPTGPTRGTQGGPQRPDQRARGGGPQGGNAPPGVVRGAFGGPR